MDLRELKIQFLNAKVVTDDIKVMFRTPDCYAYYNCNCHIAKYKDDNVLIIDLIDKVKPTFKVGDKVTNVNGLFPDRGYTIAEVNEEEQYYTYKEVHGRTYFKYQDQLKLVEIKPKFKVGDKVKGVLSNNPDKEFIINGVDTQLERYHYFNGVGTTTKFKDQDKLTLVESDSSKLPVEGETKLAESILAVVKAVRTTKLKGTITFNIPKNIDTFKLGCKLSYNEDLKIGAELSNNGTDVITVKW